MKSLLFLTFIIIGSQAFESKAQVLNRQSATGVLLRSLDKKLPGIINSNSPVENLKIDALRIRRSHVKVKGNFMIQPGKTRLFDKPFRFKSRLSTNFKNPDVVRLKVHIPGDKFLFFRRYRKII